MNDFLARSSFFIFYLVAKEVIGAPEILFSSDLISSSPIYVSFM